MATANYPGAGLGGGGGGEVSTAGPSALPGLQSTVVICQTFN